MLFSNKKILGVDIGSSSIKLVELSRKSRNYNLESLGVSALPKGSIVDGQIIDINTVSTVLRDLVRATKTSGAYAYTGLFGEGVIIKRIKVSVMTKSELEHHIRWEAEQYIPYNIDEVNIDYDVINTNYKKLGKMDIIIAAAKKDMVSAYSAVLYDSGLIAKGVDIGSFALFDMYKQNYEFDLNDTLALIDIGASRTLISVIEKGKIIFTKEIENACDYISRKIQSELAVSFEEAENLKVVSEEAGIPPEVENILIKELKNLGIEIRKNLDLCLASVSDFHVDEVVICGGGSKTIGINYILEKTLNLPVSIANPFKQIAFNVKIFPESYIKKVASYFNVSVGLAIRGLRF